MLAKMQHYGVHTRLLDFTENPLVALCFACSGRYNSKDEQVFMFVENDHSITTCYSPISNLIANMYDKLGSSFDQYVREIYLSEIQKRIEKPVFVIPEMHYERQIRQHSVFLIYSDSIYVDEDSKEIYLLDNMEPVTDADDRLKECFKIESNCKDKILRDLKYMGISKSTLFPEPENVCADIMDETKGLLNW